MFFIFDWDGTLSDSTDKIIRCMQGAAVRAGLVAPADHAVKNIIGLGLPEAIRTLFPGASAELVSAVRQGYSEIYAAEDRVPSPFYPGVEETLNQLRDRGFQLAVATGKSRRGLDRVLTNLGMVGFFHGSRCADETASKPDPQMLHELLEEFGVQSEGALMVGDTEYDMEMAVRANMPRVAVDYGAHHVDRLLPYQPKLCLTEFTDLLKLLDAV